MVHNHVIGDSLEHCVSAAAHMHLPSGSAFASPGGVNEFGLVEPCAAA